MAYGTYKISDPLIKRVAKMREFKMGGTQASVVLTNGKVFYKVLIANCMYIQAVRGYDKMPFSPEDIVDIYQSGDDDYPAERGNWVVF